MRPIKIRKDFYKDFRNVGAIYRAIKDTIAKARYPKNRDRDLLAHAEIEFQEAKQIIPKHKGIGPTATFDFCTARHSDF